MESKHQSPLVPEQKKTAPLPEEVPVQYIGRKPRYKDRLYGTKLEFEPEQTRTLPREIAKRFLRHGDMFAIAKEKATEPKKAQTPQKDDTQEQLEKAAREKDENQSKEAEIQHLKDQIMATQDKETIERFCLETYQQTIDKRFGLEKAREQAIAFIDQFGPA